MLAWARVYGKGAKRSGMSGRPCGFTQPMAIFCQQTCQCQCLPRAFETACGPRSPEYVLYTSEKLRLSTDLVLVHTTRATQQLLAEIWTLPD
jgi:hypothetical protein